MIQQIIVELEETMSNSSKKKKSNSSKKKKKSNSRKIKTLQLQLNTR